VKIKKKKSKRGFILYEFLDRYDISCSIQKSSMATENAIWFKVDYPSPKVMASKIIPGGAGWAKYPIPDDVSINT
jgi:hypothetical protein